MTPLTAVVGSVTLAAGLVTVFTGSDQRARFFNGAAVVAGVQILITLAVFSLSSNRDDRYLLPLVAYAVLLVAWALARLEQQLIPYAMMACFALQWGHAHAQARPCSHG